jgi:hypothetical protein
MGNKFIMEVTVRKQLFQKPMCEGYDLFYVNTGKNLYIPEEKNYFFAVLLFYRIKPYFGSVIQ